MSSYTGVDKLLKMSRNHSSHV